MTVVDVTCPIFCPRGCKIVYQSCNHGQNCDLYYLLFMTVWFLYDAADADDGCHEKSSESV